MAKTNKGWNNFFIGFGVVTTLSGIYQMIQSEFITGFFGAIVGVFLIYQNIQKPKDVDS